MSEREGQLDLESKIAKFVHAYIDAARSDDSAGEPEALRWMCCGLEWLLGYQLQALEGSAGWWVDGVIPATDMLPDAISVASSHEVSIRGYAMWAKGSPAPFWIEPFFGIVRISESGDSIAGYQLHFGDAVRGLGKVPYGKHLRWVDWFFPQEWVMTFSEGVFKAEHLQ